MNYMHITPKTSGFVVTVNYERPKPSEEFAYSDLDDMINGLIRLLGPVQPMAIGVDLAEPGSDMSIEHVQRPDGTSSTTWVDRNGFVETLDDDGWRVWEGGKHAKDYPPGVKADTKVEVRHRLHKTIQAEPFIAGNLRWTHNRPTEGDRDWDIVAYRVVKP